MAPPPPTTSAVEARWRLYAACAQAGTELFFELTNPTRRRAAKAVCATCPAAEPCLWAALAAEQTAGYRHGIWGGTTPARRARIAATLPPAGLAATYLAVIGSWSPPPAVTQAQAAAA